MMRKWVYTHPAKKEDISITSAEFLFWRLKKYLEKIEADSEFFTPSIFIDQMRENGMSKTSEIRQVWLSCVRRMVCAAGYTKDGRHTTDTWALDVVSSGWELIGKYLRYLPHL